MRTSAGSTPGRTPLRRRAARLTRRAMAATRPKVTAQERHARKLLRARSSGICEVCGHARATNAHHRRKPGRVWTVENLLHVCGQGNSVPGCHSMIELNPRRSREQGWIVLSHRNPADVPVWLYGREFCLLTDTGDIEQLPEEVA